MSITFNINDSNHFVKETPTLYMSGNLAIPIYDLTSIQKMKIIRRGITKKYLENLKSITSLDYDSLASALSVTRNTLINKKGDEKFSDQISERIVSLADLYSFGYEVFENQNSFNQWMFASNQALGGLTPFSIVDNYYGREEIKNLIGRIAYGVYS